MVAYPQNKLVKKRNKKKNKKKTNKQNPHWSHCLGKLKAYQHQLSFLEMKHLQCQYQTEPSSKEDFSWWWKGDCYTSSPSLPSSSLSINPIRAIFWHLKLKVVCKQVLTFSTQTKFSASKPFVRQEHWLDSLNLIQHWHNCNPSHSFSLSLTCTKFATQLFRPTKHNGMHASVCSSTFISALPILSTI